MLYQAFTYDSSTRRCWWSWMQKLLLHLLHLMSSCTMSWRRSGLMDAAGIVNCSMWKALGLRKRNCQWNTMGRFLSHTTSSPYYFPCLCFFSFNIMLGHTVRFLVRLSSLLSINDKKKHTNREDWVENSYKIYR